MHGQQAELGAQGRLPGLLIGFVGAILRAPAMAGYLSAYRGASATQTLGNGPHRAAAGDSKGDVFGRGQWHATILPPSNGAIPQLFASQKAVYVFFQS